jgi:hypothetical protein
MGTPEDGKTIPGANVAIPEVFFELAHSKLA